ncbi:ribonuclease H-like protein [Ceratobasidium sp. AG-I]|nr:ribonuclease H-like protein [Ceratobasidium sp. AG-I]
MGKRKTADALPGSNWMALKKSLPPKTGVASRRTRPKEEAIISAPAFPRGTEPTSSKQLLGSDVATLVDQTNEDKNLTQLKHLVLGIGKSGETLTDEPGRYLALDCEMVGVGEDGKESSLARASVVDFHGRVVLDEFVQQRERVTDYRTQYSGIRPEDMVEAKPFKDIQTRIADLLAPPERILVGHALSNDLAALLLTHPASRTRDTQLYVGRKPTNRPAKSTGKGKQNADATNATNVTPSLWDKYRTPRVALKRLTKEELGLDIQSGEHSSITDARAAMAIYRLHKRAWDASLPVSHVKPSTLTLRQELDVDHDSDDSGRGDEAEPQRKRRPSNESFPGGGRRGVSSGLSTIVRANKGKATTRKGAPTVGPKNMRHSQAPKGKWWQTLGGTGGSTGSKGQIHLP